MGVSKLPDGFTPERWELIFYIVSILTPQSRKLMFAVPNPGLDQHQRQLGGATCLWAVVIWVFLPDSPSNARFFNHRERLVAVKRVSGNETGIKNKAFDKKQVWVGFTDPKTILLFTSVFAA